MGSNPSGRVRSCECVVLSAVHLTLASPNEVLWLVIHCFSVFLGEPFSLVEGFVGQRGALTRPQLPHMECIHYTIPSPRSHRLASAFPGVLLLFILILPSPVGTLASCMSRHEGIPSLGRRGRVF